MRIVKMHELVNDFSFAEFVLEKAGVVIYFFMRGSFGFIRFNLLTWEGFRKVNKKYYKFQKKILPFAWLMILLIKKGWKAEFYGC